MKDDDDFAFPHQDAGYLGDFCHGMTLRDYFAAKAMEGDWSSQGDSCGIFIPESSDELFDRSAKLYYRMADAMLRVRNIQS